jgi:hypothetical protein
MRFFLIFNLLLLWWGCASNPPPMREEARAESVRETPPGAVLLVHRVQEEGTPKAGSGAFVPLEWMDGWNEEALRESGYRAEVIELDAEPAMARRPPRRRGPGSGVRGPPPLLNPRPTPEQMEQQRRRAADHAAVLASRQLYFQRLREAEQKYPDFVGQYHHHHFIPIYLGGRRDGVTYRIPASYHVAITQSFRTKWQYGQPHPEPVQLRRILLEVYTEYPIPQLLGITP